MIVIVIQQNQTFTSDSAKRLASGQPVLFQLRDWAQLF